ncbi:MAG: zinc ribbon domain-containing protein [Chloroflexi bacterium]|nr:zinc ribbon domain-containing protein [Chloroflexota bacterium]
MFIILSFLLAITALLVVAYPLLNRSGGLGRQPTGASAEERLGELLAQRDAAFQALRDLHFDRQMGKIADEDFVGFEAHLKEVAADALRRLDDWEATVDRSLGPAAASSRQPIRSPNGRSNSTLEAEIAARRAALASGRACPTCGRLAAAADQFCGACGAELAVVKPPTPTAAICPKCSRPLQPALGPVQGKTIGSAAGAARNCPRRDEPQW